MEVGAVYRGNGRCSFTVWAPFKEDVSIRILHPKKRTISMEKDERGYWSVHAEGVWPGTQYVLELDHKQRRPDPASFYQPDGVHGPSEVIDHKAFVWEDRSWNGVPLEEMVLYEIHTGTFTPEGSFEAIIPRLASLKDLGITTLEIMPVAQFPGSRNWGYDGVYPFAVHSSYGGPPGLKKLVNACHSTGLAVVLDVVYNHLGPEGNYFQDYGPYFTEKYKTFWGKALNFDDEYSSEARNYFIQNMKYWFLQYHIDGLRLDAIHAIFDMSAKHILQELSEAADEVSMEHGRKYLLIAESDLNDVRIIRPRSKHGYGIDAQWCDDFHHALHALFTGESSGYYCDFGNLEHLKVVMKEGFYYSWRYSKYRKKYFGSSTEGIKGSQFIVFSQNHDQIGNRVDGKRLSRLVSFEALKLVAGTVLLSPFVPLLFMGEEYGEKAPFYYFVSHSDIDLIKAVREGRRREFEAFNLKEDFPDPQDEKTFISSKLTWEQRKENPHKVLLSFYKKLMKLRKTIPAFRSLEKDSLDIKGKERDKLLIYIRCHLKGNALCIMNFCEETVEWDCKVDNRIWNRIIDSADKRWLGPGSSTPQILMHGEVLRILPLSFVVYSHQMENKE